MDAARAEQEAAVAEVRRLQSDEVGELRHRMHQEAEERIRNLRELWEDEQFDASKAKDKEFEGRLRAALSAAAEGALNEQSRAVRLEASKWQQLLKEAEARVELSVQLAKTSGWEERDKGAREEVRALQQKLDMLSRRSVDADDELEQLRAQFAEDMRKLQEDHAVELQRSVQEAQTTERRRGEEAARTAMRSAEEEFAAREENLKQRLAKEQEALFLLKNDYSNQIARMAQERSDLAEIIAQGEQQLIRAREAHASEKADLKMETENDFLLREMQQQRVHKVAVQELQAKFERAMEDAEARWDQIAENRVKAEVDALSAEKEAHVAKLKADNEAEVKLMQSMIRTLKGDNAELAQKVQALSDSLEEAEDLRFDEEQNAKALAKETSFSRWHSVVGFMRMRAKLQAGLTNIDKENQARVARLEAEQVRKLSEMTLSSIKLSELLLTADSSRRKTFTILTSHKTEILIERRNQMRQYEKELQRMCNEREALETERSNTEDEIVHLSQQVQDLEEQIHEHNRSSAMQNGRINVAHVRKKRRLDNELEKLLELIEIKRGQLLEFDDKIVAKSKQRDEKEMSLIELEKDLVQILVEQQRLVLSIVEEDRVITDDCKELLAKTGLPWPPPAKATLENALTYSNPPKQEED